MNLKSKEFKPQLVFVGPWPPPYGGISSHLKQLLPALAEKGYEVMIVVPSEVNEFQVSYEGLIKVVRLWPKKFAMSKPIATLAQLVRIIRWWSLSALKLLISNAAIAVAIEATSRKDKQSIMFTYDNSLIYLSDFMIDKEYITKIYVTIYADFFLHPKKYRGHKKLLIHNLQNAELVLSCSKYCVDSAQIFLNCSFPTSVIYNNVDQKRFKPIPEGGLAIRRRLGIADSAVVLMMIARMDISMGVDFVLRRAEKILEINPKLVILLCGAKGELTDEIQSKSAINERFISVVNLPENEKHLFLNSCDIFMAPTMKGHACMGIAIIEAMMCGKPVVVSNSGGHSETVDSSSGYVIPFIGEEMNFDLFVDRISLLVSDQLKRKKMGERARQRAVRLFANEVIVERHLDLIENSD